MNFRKLVIGSGELSTALSRAGWTQRSYDSVISDIKILSRFDLIFAGFSFRGQGAAHHLICSKLSRGQTFILPSSRKVYQPGLNLNEESMLAANPDLYASQKIVQERLTGDTSSQSLILRLPNIISSCPDVKQSKFFSIFYRNYKNGCISLDGNPDTVKDFLCLNDLEETIDLLAAKGCRGVFNVGYGQGITLDEFVQLVFRIWPEIPVNYTNRHTDEFYLNNEKLIKAINIRSDDFSFAYSFKRILWKLKGKL